MSSRIGRFVVDELPDLAERHERGEITFPVLMASLGEAGVLRVPFDAGGRFQKERTGEAIALTAAITQRAPAVATATWSTRVQAIVLGLAHATLRDRYLDRVLEGSVSGSIGMSEPNAGTDLRGIETVASPSGTGFRVTGRKCWLTLGPVADFVLVLAKLGSRARDADFVLLVAERSMDGVRFAERAELLSHPGLPMGDVVLEDVEVPAENVIVPSKALGATLALMAYARLEAASHGCGLQRTILHALESYLRTRSIAGEALMTHTHARVALGTIRTYLAASEALTARAAEAYEQSRDASELVTMAKVFATDAASQSAGTAMRLLGSAGLRGPSPVVAALLAAKGAQIVDGTNDVMTMSAARGIPRDALGVAEAPEIALRSRALGDVTA